MNKYTIARLERYKLSHGGFEQRKLIGVFPTYNLAVEYLENELQTVRNEWKRETGIIEVYWTQIKPEWSDTEYQFKVLEIDIPTPKEDWSWMDCSYDEYA